jgi:hypothetical protein
MDTLIAVGKAPRRMRTVEEKVAIVAQTLAPGPMRYSPDAYDKETRITGRVKPSGRTECSRSVSA